MNDNKNGSDNKNDSYLEDEDMELFDNIFGEEIDDEAKTVSGKSPVIKQAMEGNSSDDEIRDIICRLNIISGPMKGHSFEIKKEVTFIGRTRENDIEMNDRTISRKHVKITRNKNNFFIEDLGSHNGLMVNGDRVRSGKAIELMEGTVYSIGDSEFSVEILDTEYSENKDI